MTATQHPYSPGTPSGAEGTQDSGVKETAQQAAGTAAQEGKRVADVARGEAKHVAAEASTQARNLLSDVTSEAEHQSRVQKDRLAGTVRTFGDDLEQMASNGSGLAADVAGQVAQRARSLSSQLESREPRELLDEVRTFARQRPGTFLLGALAAGMIAGRLARGAKEASSTDSSTSSSTATTTATPSGMTGAPVQPTYEAPPPPPPSGAAVYDPPPAPGTATGDPLSGPASGPEAGYGSRPAPVSPDPGSTPESPETGGWR